MDRRARLDPTLGPGNSRECACADFTLSRRRLLQGFGAMAGAGVLSYAYGNAFTQVALASSLPTEAAQNVLVVLSLRGGADGLSLVVPHGDPLYANARGNLAIPRKQLLKKDRLLGLNPALKPLQQLWDDRKFAVVNSVGLKVANRSHFAAMEEVEDADLGSEERRGWINRLIGLTEFTGASEAAQIGTVLVPGSLYGPEPVVAFPRIKGMVLTGRDGDEAQTRRVAALRKAWDDSGLQTPMHLAANDAIELSADFAAIPENPEAELLYPENSSLGESLYDAARLIRSPLGVRVITIDAGSWDMHRDIGKWDNGLMHGEIDGLARCVAAFFADLGTTASRVTVVTISEFGRRVSINGNDGLDHGWGSVMMLLGAGVNGGKYHGKFDGLAPEDLEDGDVKVKYDFRTVLYRVVESRFPEINASAVFPQFSPDPKRTLNPML